MSLRISFELSDNDIKHFREAMRKARRTVRMREDSEIVSEARPLFEDVDTRQVPVFVRHRIELLKAMTDMLEDEEWHMRRRERERVLTALAYFRDPDDLIPDEIPGLGFLDDAIMIELAVRELKHEIEAYRDFCSYREKYDSGFRLRRNADTRARKLAAREQELRERAARRRDKEQGPAQVL